MRHALEIAGTAAGVLAIGGLLYAIGYIRGRRAGFARGKARYWEMLNSVGSTLGPKL
jgi:hypothetical protein